jgi:anti-sigma-K factor RskA
MTDTRHYDFLEEASAYALGALDADERREFEAHLATCETCQAEVASHRRVASALGLGEIPVAPPVALKDRMIARVTGQRVAAPVAPASSSTATPMPVRASRSMPAWLALAAAVVAAAGLAMYAWTLRTQLRELQRVLSAADHQMGTLRADLAAARGDAQRLSGALQVLGAADLVRVDLAGGNQPIKPTGRAFWSRSRGLLLSAAGLPPPGAGRTYQIWLVAPNRAPVGAGFIAVSAAGAGTAVVHPQSPPASGATMTVAITNEPAGGSPGPTTPILLAGTAKTE